MEDDPPLIERPWANAARMAFIALGAFVIVMPLWEFWPALWPPNLLTPFFGLIAGGACWIGWMCIQAGLYGEDQRWRFEPGAIVIERRLWSKVTRSTVRADDLSGIRVVRDTSGEGPDTWFVLLQLKGGTDFESHRYASAARAEGAARWLRRHLGAGEGTPIP